MKPLTTPPERITVEMLQARHACPYQVERFEEEWPAGAPLTADNLIGAADSMFNIAWLGKNFLSNQRARSRFQRFYDQAYDKFIAADERAGTDAEYRRCYVEIQRDLARALIKIWGLADAAPGRAA